MQVDSTPTNNNMKPFKKYLIFAVALLIVLAGFYAYKEYNRKAADLSTVNADEIINVTDLIHQFETDEAAATKKFAGKTLLVTGNITEIENQQDTLYNIFLGDETAIYKVSCLMDIRKKDAFKNISVGKQISIKGICTGFLADVEMNHCVIVNEK